MKNAVQRASPLVPVQCEIQALRVGPLTLLGISGEPFFEIGEKIRRQWEKAPLWPLGYTNAYFGYLPTEDEYPRGGYEVDDAWKYVGMWKLDASCERRVLRAAIDVLGKLGQRP